MTIELREVNELYDKYFKNNYAEKSRSIEADAFLLGMYKMVQLVKNRIRYNRKKAKR